MSRRIKLPLKNVTNGINNLSGFLAGQKSIYPHGLSRCVVTSAAPCHRSDSKYVKQDYSKCNSLGLIKQFNLARTTRGPSSNYITSETRTFSINWFDTVSFGSKSLSGLPYYCYYDVPKPQCPPLDPKPCDHVEKKSPGASPAKGPVCPLARITCQPSKNTPCYVPKRRTPSEKTPKKKSPCGINFGSYSITIHAKIDGPANTNCPPPPKCPSKKGPSQGGGGSVCPPAKKVKDCPPSRKGGKGGSGSQCPAQKKVKDCPPKRKSGGGGGSQCPSQKKYKECPSRRKRGGGTGGGSSCPPPKKTSCASSQKGPTTTTCPPKSDSSSCGKSSKKPLIQRAPTCPPKDKKC